MLVALCVQYAMRMGSSVLACPAEQNFSILSHKRHDFGVKGIESKICVDFLYNLF
jgi:hypothetical protein